VEGKIINHHVSILIDLGGGHSYIDPKIVDIFHLKKSNIEISWLVQITTGTKRRIKETTIYCLINMNEPNTSIYLNIIPLGSHDMLLLMDWLDKHHVVLDFHNKTFICLDEQGK
jgi:hypothetical protein